MDIIEKIKSKTKNEWIALLRGFLDQARAWIQANGERSAIAALVVGIFVVIFYKIVFGLLFLAAVAATMVWLIAPDSKDTTAPRSHGDDSDQSNSGV